MSRLLVLVAMVIAIMAASVSAIAAQDASPAAEGGALGELGLPEVVIVLGDAGFEVPADVQAGTVLLTFQNDAPFPAGFSLIQLPEGVTMESLMGPPADAAASPPAEEGGLPPALYDAIWAGGLFATPGVPAQAVVTLTAGEWILLTPPDAGLPPAMLTVTGEAQATEVNVDAVSVELDDYQVRLPEVVSAGPQIWNVANAGSEPHEVFITKTPERLTLEQAEALLLAPPDAEPDPSLPNPAEFIQVGGVAPLSQDQSSLVELNLEPGHYVAVCFIPGEESGAPHAAMGMVTIFSVGADGETVEPHASPEPEEQARH